MKRAIILSSAILTVICMFSAGAYAQNPESGFFLDNYTFSYKLNPAIMPENNFIAIGVGNISAGIDSKLSLGSFLFPGADGRLVTGLNSSVSATEFLSKFSKANKIGEKINMNLLSFGIRKENSLSTFEINLREDFETSIPRDLFSFMKEGSSYVPYDLSPLKAGVNAMIEVALGHTRRIDNIVFGLRMKLLLGAAAGEVYFNQFDLTSNANTLGINARGGMKVACNPLELCGSASNPLYIDDVRFAMENIGTAGLGFGFDFGAKWYVNDDLSVTLGINDLGGMSWKYNNVFSAELDKSFEGFSNVGTDTDLEKELNEFWEDVKNSAKVNKVENTTEFQAVPFSANAGLRYRLPFYKRLSVGFLANYDYSKYSSLLSARVGATITPINWFSLSGNVGYSTCGTVLGAMTSITLLGINVFAGFDGYMGACSGLDFRSLGLNIDPNLPIQRLNVPINSFYYKFSLGVSIQFGKRKADYIKNNNKNQQPE